MSIGYSVEGSTDRAFIKGLHRRWLPSAKLVEGAFRGTSIRREIPKICLELTHKGVEAIIFLTDANLQPRREVKQRESQYVPVKYQHLTIYGVADRNIECWLAADREYLAQQIRITPKELDVTDPKDVIEHAMGITSYDKKEEEIVAIVISAPIRNWLNNSRSFEEFYEEARSLSKRLNQPIPNEREKSSAGY